MRIPKPYDHWQSPRRSRPLNPKQFTLQRQCLRPRAQLKTHLSHMCCRSIVGVLGLGFTATEGSGAGVERASMFMVTELCTGGSLREMILAQMIAGRKVYADTYSCLEDVVTHLLAYMPGASLTVPRETHACAR